MGVGWGGRKAPGCKVFSHFPLQPVSTYQRYQMWSWEETYTISCCELRMLQLSLAWGKSFYLYGISDFIPYSQPPAGWQFRGYSLFIDEETETNHRAYTLAPSQIRSPSLLVSFSFPSVAQTSMSMRIFCGVLTHRLLGSILSSSQVWSRAWVCISNKFPGYWSWNRTSENRCPVPRVAVQWPKGSGWLLS